MNKLNNILKMPIDQHRSGVRIVGIAIIDTGRGYVDPADGHPIGAFTTYVVSTNFSDGRRQDARRRYSEFELLHGHLLRSQPACIIPPIPEKHSFLETVAMYTSIVKREDARTVDKRRRLLSSFLINVLNSDRLRDDPVFLAFLEGDGDGGQWSETALRAAGDTPAPIPLLSGSVEQLHRKHEGIVDIRLVELEQLFKRHQQSIVTLEECERKRLRKLNCTSSCVLLSHPPNLAIYDALCDLGCAYNAFSLEYDEPSGRICKQLAVAGEAADEEAACLHDCIVAVEAGCDRLHEQAQFCMEAQRLLGHIVTVALHVDSTVRACQSRRAQLASMEAQGSVQPTTTTGGLAGQEQQLKEVDREKVAAETEYSRALTIGLDELNRQSQRILVSLSDVLRCNISAAVTFHSKLVEQVYKK